MAKRQVIQLRPQETSWESKHREAARSLTWEESLEDYLFFKRSCGRKETTLEDLRQKLGQFFRKYPKAWPTDLKKAAQSWLGQDHIGPATYKAHHADARHRHTALRSVPASRCRTSELQRAPRCRGD